MSKCFDNAIGVRDEPDEIRAKVRTFVTDPQKVRMGDPGRPEICPVFALHKLFSPDIRDWTEEHCRIGDLGLRGLQDEPRRSRDRVLPAVPRAARGARGRPRTRGEGRSPTAPTKVRPIVQETLAAVRSAMHFA